MMRERCLRSSLFPFALFVATVGAAAAASIGVVAPREAHASVAFAISLEELAGASTAIARVTAIDRESAWEDGRIVTYSRVRIDSVIAGVVPRAAEGARELTIRTLGGRVGNIGQLVEGEASLAPAESSLVFLVAPAKSPKLAARAAESFGVMGRAQGQLVVRKDLHGREIVRVGAVGELIERRIHPPLRAAGRRVVELDGASFDTAASDAKRAWETSHAH